MLVWVGAHDCFPLAAAPFPCASTLPTTHCTSPKRLTQAALQIACGPRPPAPCPASPTSHVHDAERLVHLPSRQAAGHGHDDPHAALVLLHVELEHALLRGARHDGRHVHLADQLDVDGPPLWGAGDPVQPAHAQRPFSLECVAASNYCVARGPGPLARRIGRTGVCYDRHRPRRRPSHARARTFCAACCHP